METKKEIPIYLDLQGNYHPTIFDLSGKAPFELYLQVRRSVTSESDPRDMVIRRNGSVFDLPAALDKGLLELIDEDTKTAICRPESRERDEHYQDDSPSQTLESLIKLPTDFRGRGRPTQSVPLGAATVLRPMVQPGHRYTLKTKSNDLGVQWWTWRSSSQTQEDVDISASPEPTSLVSHRSAWSRSFRVVSELEMPPRLTIKLALAKEDHATDDQNSSGSSKLPAPIQITITNTHDRPITVKTTGDQHHLQPRGEIANPRSRVTATNPDVRNFSIIDPETQEDFISDAPTFISTTSGGGKLLRKQLLTIAPQEQIIRTARLLGRGLTAGKDYRISLRPAGCWWAFGTLDDLFGDEDSTSMKWPSGPLLLPMPLESDDVVVFRACD
ncbi:hypothetical protein PFICI_12691 [Pestalotiopsis fici W106-1]|uniref:Uncharacterized protein n=1 Tax=Pestalotiopsis fici (strain W106-1 / CGMCC3.15140) TaxID=1229662 RepID=W3WRJ8_PESFW|nr:uncharacterized protein PFICI_12691 [Pestalotiopsis fici W106-1]ETS75747.1 hypothetical protein PFICI_12691 [Pestalotiopsis fici W106-1]